MIAAVASTLLLTSCDTYMDVYSDYDSKVNFTKYTTYAWLPDADSTKTIYNNQVVRNNARNYVDDNLAQRDFRLDINKPDVLLDLVVVNNHTENVYPAYSSYSYPQVNAYPVYPYYPVTPNPYYSNTYGSYYYSYPGYYAYPYTTYSMGYTTQYVTEYDVEGSVTLNMIDRKENKLVWTATAIGNLYDPDFNEDNLSAAIDNIMAKYPIDIVDPSGQ